MMTGEYKKTLGSEWNADKDPLRCLRIYSCYHQNEYPAKWEYDPHIKEVWFK